MRKLSAKRKILFADVALNISIITLLLITFLLFFICNRLLNIHMLNNGFYSANKYSFSIPVKTSTYDDIKNMYSKCMENTILYKELSRYEDLRGLLIKGKIDAHPMIQGRFFVEKDFYKGHYYAVIGTNQKDKAYESHHRFYIDLAGKPYEVIGIVGSKKYRSPIDYSIYVNLDSFSEVDNNTGLYHLDGISDKSIKQSLAEINMDLKIVDLGNYGILNVFYGQVPAVLLLVCVVSAFISFTIFFSYEWFRAHHKLIEAMTVIGLGCREKVKEIAFQYFCTILPSLAMTIIGLTLLFIRNLLWG